MSSTMTRKISVIAGSALADAEADIDDVGVGAKDGDSTENKNNDSHREHADGGNEINASREHESSFLSLSSASLVSNSFVDIDPLNDTEVFIDGMGLAQLGCTDLAPSEQIQFGVPDVKEEKTVGAHPDPDLEAKAKQYSPDFIDRVVDKLVGCPPEEEEEEGTAGAATPNESFVTLTDSTATEEHSLDDEKEANVSATPALEVDSVGIVREFPDNKALDEGADMDLQKENDLNSRIKTISSNLLRAKEALSTVQGTISEVKTAMSSKIPTRTGSKKDATNITNEKNSESKPFTQASTVEITVSSAKQEVELYDFCVPRSTRSYPVEAGEDVIIYEDEEQVSFNEDDKDEDKDDEDKEDSDDATGIAPKRNNSFAPPVKVQLPSQDPPASPFEATPEIKSRVEELLADLYGPTSVPGLGERSNQQRAQLTQLLLERYKGRESTVIEVLEQKVAAKEKERQRLDIAAMPTPLLSNSTNTTSSATDEQATKQNGNLPVSRMRSRGRIRSKVTKLKINRTGSRFNGKHASPKASSEKKNLDDLMRTPDTVATQDVSVGSQNSDLYHPLAVSR